MGISTLFTGLAIISSLNMLATEGVKKLLDEAGIKYATNLLAVIVAIIVTIGASACYIVYADIAVTGKVIVEVIAMVFMSFLCATVGFDKVKQTLEQLGGKKTGEN